MYGRKDGTVSSQAVYDAVNSDTVLVSMMRMDGDMAGQADGLTDRQIDRRKSDDSVDSVCLRMSGVLKHCALKKRGGFYE